MDRTPIEYLYEALASERGIEVETNNIRSLITRLYKARDAADDPALRVLALVPSRISPTTHLWIVKKEIVNVKD